eukprot:104419-Rhodomonas_salina.1
MHTSPMLLRTPALFKALGHPLVLPPYAISVPHTIRYLSTAHHTPSQYRTPYAISVPYIAYHERRQIAPYAMSVPDMAHCEHHTLC